MHDFGNGVYFVPLAAISDPELVLSSICQSLGLRNAGDLPFFERLRTYLRHKNMLLLLDNFEQVVKAAPLLVRLLEVCPDLKVVVTSRTVLHVQGEHIFTVPTLALPDPKHLPDIETLSQYAGVELFNQRALAVKPTFAITEANAAAVAEICTHLDGLPLAIELASTYIRLLSPQALLIKLRGHRLPVLSHGLQDGPVRQQTLRNTIMWSYGLLDNEEQKLFRRLSVFIGGCTLEAIEAVYVVLDADATNVLEKAASLLDKSLLQQIDQNGDDSRLLMLETIRECGLECLLMSDEQEVTSDAHAGYYLALAEKAELELSGTQQSVWLDQLERDHENLRAALHWFVEREQIEAALRLSGALWWFWSVRGHVSEGRRWLERTLARSEGVLPAIRAKTLSSACMLALNQDDYDQAERLCEESLMLFQESADKRGSALSLYRLGLVAWWKGDFIKARSLHEESLALFREVGDIGGSADPLLLLARMAFVGGEYSQARSLAEESVTSFRELSDKWGLAYALLLLAQVIFALGDDVKARALLEEGLALSRELGYKGGIADALGLQGQFVLHEGNIPMARLLTEESLSIFKEVGDRRGTAKTCFLLAKVVMLQGNESAAHSLYEESMFIAGEVNDKKLWASCKIGLAETPEQVQAIWRQRQALVVRQLEKGTPTRIITKPRLYPDGLTAREIEVLRLVAQGLTDAEVAENLIISCRTVHAHLSSIYSKLSISSRSAATRYAFEHTLI